MKYQILIVILGFQLTGLFAQFSPQDEQKEVIMNVVNAYNDQDYKKMKSPWMLLGKLVVSKNALRQEFEPFYRKYGQAKIDTISCSSVYSCTALLQMEKDKNIRKYLHFVFTDNNKLMGFGYGYPIFIYPKDSKESPSSTLSIKEKSKAVDSLIKSIYLSDSIKAFTGCILLVQDNEIIYKNCNGYLDRELKTPLNDSSRFLLASCSKQFTAFAIMLLQEEGKLHVSDNVKKHLHSFPYDNIRIENLLTHTSGLPDYMKLLKKHWDKEKMVSNQDILELLVKHQPKCYFEANKSFDYSNTAYILLSLIIEKASGMSYAEFMEEKIFQALGMHQSIVYARRKEAAVDNYALGYVYSEKHDQYVLPDSLPQYEHVKYMDGLTGDDGISSSINDMFIWNTALKERKLLNDSSYARIFSRHRLNDGKEVNYGYGFFLEGGEGGEAAERLSYHTGFWPGYMIMSMYFNDRDIYILLLSNNSYPKVMRMTDDIATELLK